MNSFENEYSDLFDGEVDLMQVFLND